MHKQLRETEGLVFFMDWRRCQEFDALVGGVTPWGWPSGNLHDRLSRVFSETLSARGSEREARIELNLASSTDGGKYSADVVGEVTRRIREHGVSIPSQGERTLRITRDGKIGMIEQIVGFRSKCNLRAFRQLEALLQREIKLCERGAA